MSVMKSTWPISQLPTTACSESSRELQPMRTTLSRSLSPWLRSWRSSVAKSSSSVTIMPPSAQTFRFFSGCSEKPPERPKVPALLAVDVAEDALAGILDHRQVVLLGDLHQRRHVGHLAGEVDRHERLGALA